MKTETGQTYYSKDVAGDPRNYDWKVSFDITDGYVGINQMQGGGVADRVLLSPAQIRELLAFLEAGRG